MSIRRAVPGTWNAICDASGFTFKASEMVRQWDGAYVAKRFADRRNPQDFVKGVPDRQDVPWARPQGPDVFIDPLDPVTPADL